MTNHVKIHSITNPRTTRETFCETRFFGGCHRDESSISMRTQGLIDSAEKLKVIVSRDLFLDGQNLILCTVRDDRGFGESRLLI